jgi:sugar lactone lactonase YvrE
MTYVKAGSWVATSLDNAYLYVVCSSFNSIYSYGINQSTGVLTAIGVVSTEILPTSISVGSDGSTFFCANRTSNTLTAFSVTKSPGVTQLLGNSAYPSRCMQVSSRNKNLCISSNTTSAGHKFGHSKYTLGRCFVDNYSNRARVLRIDPKYWL